MSHFHRTHPRARKPHKCALCNRAIHPGETYMRGSGMESGTAWTWKECAHCEGLARLVATRLYDDEYSFDLIADWEPATIAEARVRAQWRRNWTSRSGELYPVPVVIERADKYGHGRPASIEPGDQGVAA